MNLGNIGDKVIVKPGYGRNFLLKTGKALRFNKENLEYVSKKKDELDEAPPNQTGAAVQATQAQQAANAPAQSPTQGAAPAPAPPDPKVAQQAKQQQVAAQKAVGELATASKELAGHIKTMQTIAPGLGMDVAKDPEIQAMQQLAGNLDAKAKATAAAAKQIPDPTKIDRKSVV